MTGPLEVPFRKVVSAAAMAADRNVWLTARRDGIGSSDIPAIMGVSTFGSAQHVYYDKRGELEPEGDISEAALWGSLDEETTAREWARRNRSIVQRIGLIARKDADHHRCTLDREVRECPLNRAQKDRCALEVKHRNSFVATKWKRKVPDDVLAQTLWQIHVTGFDHIHVACRIGGIDYRQYTVTRKGNEEVIADIVTVVDRLWGDIKAGRVPELTGAEPAEPLLDLYDRLHPDRAGAVALDPYDAAAVRSRELLLEYETQRLIEARAKKAKEAAKVALIEKLGGGEVGLMHGEAVFTFMESAGKANCDLAKLAERYPDAYADCVSSKPSRRFMLDPSQRLKEIPE